MTDDPVEFAPAYGEPGSWVTLPDGRVGQVWAVAGCRNTAPGQNGAARCGHKRCPPAVWVADGREWILVTRADLAESDALPMSRPMR